MSRASVQHDMRPLRLLHEYSIKTTTRCIQNLSRWFFAVVYILRATTSWHASHRLALQNAAAASALRLFIINLWIMVTLTANAQLNVNVGEMSHFFRTLAVTNSTFSLIYETNKTFRTVCASSSYVKLCWYIFIYNASGLVVFKFGLEAPYQVLRIGDLLFMNWIYELGL